MDGPVKPGMRPAVQGRIRGRAVPLVLPPTQAPSCSEVLGGPEGGVAGTALLMPTRLRPGG